MANQDAIRLKARTAGGIPYNQFMGYPRFNCTVDQVNATEKYVINASQVEAFYRESFPVPTVNNDQIRVQQTRTMPGANNLFTKRVLFEPLDAQIPGDPLNVHGGAAGTKGFHRYYLATIEYSNQDENQFEHRMTAGAEFISVPAEKTELQDADVTGRGLQKFSTSGVSETNRNIQGAYVVVVPTIEHTLHWDIITEPNWKNIDAHLGMVNSDSPSFLNEAYQETLLFTGYTARKLWIWGDANVWSIDMHFSQKQVNQTTKDGGDLEAGVGRHYGWNHVYSPKHGRWMKLTRKGLVGEGFDAEPYYDAFNFTDKLQNFPGIARFRAADRVNEDNPNQLARI